MPNPEHGAAPDGAEDKLQQAFEQTYEFKLYQEFATALQDLSHSTTRTVAIPTRFLRLAADQITDPDHWPFTFPVLERAFNRIVVALRMPPSWRMPPRPLPERASGHTPDGLEGKLWSKFGATAEHRRWRRFIAALEGIEQSTAPTVEVPTAFVRIAHLGLEPFRFHVLRDVWNRLCDKMDQPERRREGPAPTSPSRRRSRPPLPPQGDFMKDRDAAHVERFLATEEGQEWQDFVETTNKALEEEDEDLIYVPAAFLRRVIADIAVDPLVFPSMAEAWERAAAQPRKGE